MSIYGANWYKNNALVKQDYEDKGDLLIPLLCTTTNGEI